jgi:hypothetical protein
MRVYVGASSRETARAEMWMAALKAVGIEVVSTWPEVIRRNGGEANPMHAPREDRAVWSEDDLAELSTATVFWFLLPTGEISAGAYTEFGYALSMNEMSVDFWVLTSGKETSIFTALADNFEEDRDAFKAIMMRWGLIKTIEA